MRYVIMLATVAMVGCAGPVGFLAGWRIIPRNGEPPIDSVDINEYNFRVECGNGEERMVFEERRDGSLKMFRCTEYYAYPVYNSCGRLGCR